MKSQIFSLIFFTFTFSAFSQGINFQYTNIRAAVAQAKSQNKLLFVEVYSKTCEHCAAFEPIFKEKAVADFYNQNFVCFRLEITSPEIQSFLTPKKLFVPSLPLFLYFDGNEVLQHFAMSNPTGSDVIMHGQNAKNPTARSSNFRNRYSAGERADNFLFDLAMYCRVVCDTTLNIKIMNEYAKKLSPKNYGDKTSWLVTQKLIMDIDNPMAQNLVNNFADFKQKYPTEAKLVAENLLMSSLYSSRGNKYDATKIQQIRKQLVKIGIEAGSANARTLLPEVNYYFRNKNTAAATARANEYLSDSKAKIQDYSYIIKVFNQKATDKSYVPTLKKWVAKAMTMTTAGSVEANELNQQLTLANNKK